MSDNPPDNPPVNPPSFPFRFTRSPEYKRIYADAIRARIGNGDITAIIYKVDHETGLDINARVVIEESEIIMTWVQAKTVAMTLASIIQAIETLIGPISLPENFKIDQEAQAAVIRSLGFPTRG
jgi:hypothetical protein